MKFKALKRKKGQVFLLMAILILLYLILLSTTIFKVSQSPYIEPSANEEAILRYMDNSVSAVHELVDVALHQYTYVGMTIAECKENFELGLNDIETFLKRQSLIAKVELVENTFSIINSSTSVNPVYLELNADIEVKIENPSIIYESLLSLNITYEMQYSSIASDTNYLYAFKSINGERKSVGTCSIEVTPDTTVINLGDGRYQLDLQTGQNIKIEFPSRIYLWVIIS